jgi:hypothetical protein
LHAFGVAPYALTYYQTPFSDDRVRMRILHLLEVNLDFPFSQKPWWLKAWLSLRGAVSSRATGSNWLEDQYEHTTGLLVPATICDGTVSFGP